MTMRTSIKLLSAACAGAWLLACSDIPVAPPAQLPAPAPVAVDDDALTRLEQACLNEPLRAQNWEQLGAALQAQGQTQRAAVMLRQARQLREHDVQRDLAVLPPESVTGLDRTEIVHLGGAMVLVRRIPAALAAQPAQALPVPHAGLAPAAATLRLEISNGNGVTGLAARWARTLQRDGFRVVRLTNIRPFAEPASRIEYRLPQQAAAQDLSERVQVAQLEPCERCTSADVRIVLGRDVRSRGAP